MFLGIPELAPGPHASQSLEQKITGADGAPMVLIPSGEFLMENYNSKVREEKPLHTVDVEAFYMDVYEVTISRYVAFLRDIGRKKPSNWNLAKRKDWPVTEVSWHEAKAYCEFYGKRLPTAAEWEKAGRGTDGRIYPWGDGPPKGRPSSKYLEVGGTRVSNTKGNMKIGIFEFGKSPYGVYDLTWNVDEWVADWTVDWPAIDRDQESPRVNPKGPSTGKNKMIRGGTNPEGLWVPRLDQRYSCPPDTKFKTVGFRCAQNVR